MCCGLCVCVCYYNYLPYLLLLLVVVRPEEYSGRQVLAVLMCRGPPRCFRAPGRAANQIRGSCVIWSNIRYSQHCYKHTLEINLPEVGAKATTLLQSLREHFVLANVGIAHRATGKLHGLLEMIATNFGNWVLLLNILYESTEGVRKLQTAAATTTNAYHCRIGRVLLVFGTLNVRLDGLTNGQLAGALTDLGQVSAAEAV